MVRRKKTRTPLQHHSLVQMNHLEKEMIGLLFSKPFSTNKTVESELLLDTPPQFEEEDEDYFGI